LIIGVLEYFEPVVVAGLFLANMSTQHEKLNFCSAPPSITDSLTAAHTIPTVAMCRWRAARPRALGVVTALLAVGVCGSLAGQIDESRHQLPAHIEGYTQVDQSVVVNVASNRRTITPPGCRALKSDESFPPRDVWAKLLPGAEPTLPQSNGLKHPDYRFSIRSAADVEKAVAFATSHNLRITIINTGHDYMARNDAPSGLLLDVSRLSGIIAHSDWKPRPGGDPQPDPLGAPNIVTPAPGKQAAVTFGAGMVGSKVNELIKQSKMFVISGGARKYSHTSARTSNVR
jgi:hypothetical protein